MTGNRWRVPNPTDASEGAGCSGDTGTALAAEQECRVARGDGTGGRAQVGVTLAPPSEVLCTQFII